MSDRNLSLSGRREDIREKIIVPVISFNRDQIKEHFGANVASIESYFEIADVLWEQGKEEACRDIWRSQIVYIESSLDFYMHEISKYGTLQMYERFWKKTSEYNKITILLKDLEEGIKQSEASGTWFVTLMNRHFRYSVFMAYDRIAEQCRLLGFKMDDVIKKAFPPSGDPNIPNRDGKKVIRDLFTRRNQIAHQCDCKHENAEKNNIDKEYVLQAIADIKNFVSAIHEQISIKDAES